MRNSIDFEKVDKQESTKVYLKGDSTVLSFLTVQYCCAHPKILGFVLLKECEYMSAALSSVLTHFAINPRRVWYDNACNTYDSAMIRVPWMLRSTMLVVDRFQYSGHTCCNIFNGNVHRSIDSDRSVAAEVINSIIARGTTHISYLNGSNVIPFMKILFAQMNASAQVRDRLGRGDLEEEEILQRYAEHFKCSFAICTELHEGGGSYSTTGGISIFSRDNVAMPLRTEEDNDDDHYDEESEGENEEGRHDTSS